MNLNILEIAEKKINSYIQKKEYLLKCYKAEICPTCGKDLILDTKDKYYPKVLCENGHKLKELDDFDDPSDAYSDIWFNSIGKLRAFKEKITSECYDS